MKKLLENLYRNRHDIGVKDILHLSGLSPRSILKGKEFDLLGFGLLVVGGLTVPLFL